jgi:hypothetical protein
MNPAALPVVSHREAEDPAGVVLWVQVLFETDGGCSLCRKSGVCVCKLPGNTTVN